MQPPPQRKCAGSPWGGGGLKGWGMGAANGNVRLKPGNLGRLTMAKSQGRGGKAGGHLEEGGEVRRFVSAFGVCGGGGGLW